MTIFATIVLIAASVVGAEWVIRNALALAVWKRVFHLRPEMAGQLTDAPPLTVVIPAKDEAANIALSLESLLVQDYPNFWIVVVDDRSADETASIVRRFAEQDARVSLIQIGSLPEGWCGKNHAMHRGINSCDTPWILMTDADCRYDSPRAISAAVATAEASHTDLLSLLPSLEAHSFWEKLLLPICGGILMIWFNPNKVSNPKKAAAFANGQFMLMQREAYDAIGGHEAIKSDYMEDIALATGLKAAGRSVQFAPSEGIFRVRMYDSRKAIVAGWRRIFLGSFRNFFGLLGALLVLLGRGMTPSVSFAISLVMVLAGADPEGTWQLAIIVSSIGFAAQEIMTARFYAHAGVHWAFGLLYPFGCSYSACILVKTMLHLRPGAKITWRNTTYQARGNNNQ